MSNFQDSLINSYTPEQRKLDEEREIDKKRRIKAAEDNRNQSGTLTHQDNGERNVQLTILGIFATGVAATVYFINSCLRGGKKNSRRRKRKGRFVGGDTPDDSSKIPDSETIDKAIEIFNEYPGLLNVIKDQTCPLNPELKEGMMKIRVLLEPFVKNGGRKSRRSKKTMKTMKTRKTKKFR